MLDIMIRTISFSKSHKPPCFMRTWIVKQSTMTGAVIVGSLSHSTSSLQSLALRSQWSHSMWNGEIPNELSVFHNMRNIMKATCPFHPCVFGSVRRYLMSQCWKDALLSLRYSSQTRPCLQLKQIYRQKWLLLVLYKYAYCALVRKLKHVKSLKITKIDATRNEALMSYTCPKRQS